MRPVPGADRRRPGLAAGDTERERLGAGHLAQGYRLACLARVLGDLTVDVPPESRLVAHRLQIDGEEVHAPVDPAVVECLVALPPPSLDDLRSDQVRLADHLTREHGLPIVAADPTVLRELPPLLRQHGWRARVAVRGAEIVAVHPPDRTGLGLAIDAGTTKVAAYLVDLESGATLAGDGIMNPQIAWGEDVMSRIACAMRGQGPALQAALIDGLNGLIASLCPEPERIVEVVLVGNTAMHHLALGLPVRQLGLAPYVPAVSGALDVKARDLGLRIAPGPLSTCCRTWPALSAPTTWPWSWPVASPPQTGRWSGSISARIPRWCWPTAAG